MIGFWKWIWGDFSPGWVKVVSTLWVVSIAIMVLIAFVAITAVYGPALLIFSTLVAPPAVMYVRYRQPH